MSDMSFKQAKELAEKFELSQLSLNSTLDKMTIASDNFEKLLKKQNTLKDNVCTKDNKIVNLKILIGLNIGFIIGLLVSKYFL